MCLYMSACLPLLQRPVSNFSTSQISGVTSHKEKNLCHCGAPTRIPPPALFAGDLMTRTFHLSIHVTRKKLLMRQKRNATLDPWVTSFLLHVYRDRRLRRPYTEGKQESYFDTHIGRDFFSSIYGVALSIDFSGAKVRCWSQKWRKTNIIKAGKHQKIQDMVDIHLTSWQFVMVLLMFIELVSKCVRVLRLLLLCVRM